MAHSSIFDADETFGYIHKRLNAIEGEKGYRACNRAMNKPVGECWCYKGGPNEETLPCPTPKTE